MNAAAVDAHLSNEALGGELGKRLAELDKKATPGGWGFHDAVNHHCLTAGCDDMGGYIYVENDDGTNGELIVALRNNLPAILEALAVAEIVKRDLTRPPFQSHAAFTKRRAAEILASWAKS